MDDELYEYFSKRIVPPSPVPQVTSFYFNVDCCVRFLKMPYNQFLLLPKIVKKIYQYYFLLRSYYEEEQEKIRKKEEAKIRQEAQRGISSHRPKVRR